MSANWKLYTGLSNNTVADIHDSLYSKCKKKIVIEDIKKLPKCPDLLHIWKAQREHTHYHPISQYNVNTPNISRLTLLDGTDTARHPQGQLSEPVTLQNNFHLFQLNKTYFRFYA